MRWREVVGTDDSADTQLRSILTASEYAEVCRIVDGMVPEMRAEVIKDLVRSPPVGLTPDQRETMYHPEADNEELDREERRAKIIKMRADARHLHAEADRAEAEAASYRSGTNLSN